MRENREDREKKEAGRKALLNVEDILYVQDIHIVLCFKAREGLS